MDTVIHWLPTLGAGFALTASIAVQVVILSTFIGIVGGLVLLYGPRPLRLLARAYVDFTRGIPVLVLIFAVYYVPSRSMSRSMRRRLRWWPSEYSPAPRSRRSSGGFGSLPPGTSRPGRRWA